MRPEISLKDIFEIPNASDLDIHYFRPQFDQIIGSLDQISREGLMELLKNIDESGEEEE